MIDVPTFLMRWFFLCNLIRDVAEIQTIPYLPYSQYQSNLIQQHPHHHNSFPLDHQQQQQQLESHYEQPLSQPQNTYEQSQQYQQAPCRNIEEELWRNQCLLGIGSYPPGTQRLLVVDAMRTDLVQQLSQYFRFFDSRLRTIREFSYRRKNYQDSLTNSDESVRRNESEASVDPYLETDLDIVKHFEQGIVTAKEETLQNKTSDEQETALFVVPNQGTNVWDSADILKSSEQSKRSHGENFEEEISHQDIENNRHSLRQIREFLPQIVSAVLKSPPPSDPHLCDPVHKLRELILSRCQQDPSWGIELCWLLEAEVGRTWKSLFEHRQQTGRRLMLVLPADKAAVLTAVLNKIGAEKKEAFNLLQDAESVTAYGYSSDHLWQGEGSRGARLPSSISLLRCSHYGDTMQFIDKLTQLSLDLRRVPAIDRHDHLHEALYEMNRRLRRRMVTRGAVSIDVEDNLGPYDWPELKDLTLDMLKHSIHFTLVPDRGTWPSGTIQEPEKNDPLDGGVMQVLNIVVPESRILSSRERCPYLVRLEVAETGLDGSDARLYAAEAPRVGLTVEEALGMNPNPGATGSRRPYVGNCDIPTELLYDDQKSNSEPPKRTGTASLVGSHNFPRGGGWPTEAEGNDFLNANFYDTVRQHEYEQLHQQMHDTQHLSPTAPRVVHVERPMVTTGEALLDRIYGKPWQEVCDEVRKTSPYGHIKGWRLASFILKAGEDIRREALVMQLISKFRDWFEAEIPAADRPYLRPYTIMCVGGDAGLLECLTDAKSIDEVKKNCDGFRSLREYFERAYGPPQRTVPLPQQQTGLVSEVPGTPPSLQPHAGSMTIGDNVLTFEQAQDNFLRSLVGYSLICYILQIKDRHNANILLDRSGHIIHIDFGFVLGDTPRMGKVPIFSERAPFKLSQEFWEVLDGWGDLSVRFCKMFEIAFACASAHSEEVASLVEGIMLTLTADASQARSLAQHVQLRLRMRGPMSSPAQQSFVVELISAALTSWGTSTYDWLQKNMNGYQ